MTTREEIENIQPGQKIRVSFEAEFRQATARTIIFDRGLGWGAASLRTEGLKVEIIEPEYIDGEMYVDANGAFWKFFTSQLGNPRWTSPGSGVSWRFERPARPLRRLVPEVEA